MGQLHPFFQGLLEALPLPGSEWPAAKREQWLETARNIFALMYADPAEALPAPSRAQPVDFTAVAESRFGQSHPSVDSTDSSLPASASSTFAAR